MASSSSSSFMLLLLLLLWPLLLKSQKNNGSIRADSTLTASETRQFSSSWRSPSGDFAFGLRRIDPNKDFLPAIWFDKVPNKTIVWYVYADAGFPVPEGSSVTLTGDDGLVLRNPQGNQTRLTMFSNGSVSHAVMKDTGNFVLEDENSNKIWSSFANPTDTLLPTQVLGLNGSLWSRGSETNFTKGRFQLRLQEDGNLVLNRLNILGEFYSTYYASGTNDSQNTSNSGSQLIFSRSGELHILRRNNSTSSLSPQTGVSSGNPYYHRAVLHFDGVWVLYSHLKGENNTDWSRVWNAPPNICEKTMRDIIGSQACGHNSICTLGGDTKRPSCECPPRFSLVDENDKHGDCKPNFEMYPCGADYVLKSQTLDDLYEFIQLQDTDWPTSDYERYAAYYNQNTVESCKASCLQDCLCTATVFGNNACWKKKYPLSYGWKDSKIANMAFIKVPKRSYNPSKTPTRKKENRNALIITGSVLLGTSGFINFILLAFFGGTLISLCHKRRKSRNLGGETAIKSNLRVYKYEELVEATSEFKEELGRGAYGIVYKGVIKAGDDDIAVAVKKLDRVMQEGEKDFKNEVNVIGQTHHKNLVKLIGFCNEGQNRLLVYEFLPHGTLASFLFKYPKPSWDERKIIAVGIARGILYLHEECSTQIIHCDIKPQNILLDEYYNARISDFGLAKLLMMNQTHTQTGIRGTKGYLAPEWFRTRPIIKAKVDVYSYGVLLLEIVCCKKAVDLEDNVILTELVYDFFRKQRLINLIEGDSEAIEDVETVERYVRTAIWCIQEEPEKRPSMRRVTQMLEGVVEVGVPPNPSPYADCVSVDANGFFNSVTSELVN